MSIDRKELTRQYKTTPRMMGVATVRHQASGKSLVFASLDIQSLVNRHRAQLRLSAHPNKDLQRDWQQHGEAAFTIEIMDTLIPKDGEVDPAEELAVLEQMWLERLQPYAPAGYNRRPTK